MTQDPPLLSVVALSKHFPVIEGTLFRRETSRVRAVDGVSFTLVAGETLGIVGESGCGKSTLGRLVLRLVEPTAGVVRFEGHDLLGLKPEALRRMRPAMQIVFQDPQSALNPRMTVEDIILEPLYAQGRPRSAELSRHAGELLERVGLSAAQASLYPHEFSGGQRQRIGIARAIAPGPRFIVCDEAVSALDVSVQGQIVNLLQDLQRKMGIAYLFISHDLAVVKHIAHRVAVMYLGEIVEIAPKTALFATPRHPYTRALISSIPISHPRQRRARARLHGDVPSAMNPPPGCRFHTRCPHAQDLCKVTAPLLRTLADGHQAACHFAETLTF